MKILLISATPFEITPSLEWLGKNFRTAGDRFISGSLELIPLVTGVGLVATTYHLGRKLASESVDLVLQAGIAGSFRTDWKLGTVYQVISERFGDLGTETAEQDFLDLFDLQLLESDELPYSENRLLQPDVPLSFLPQAHGISVQKVHGSEASIRRIREKYDPDLESMEGAACFYVCMLEGVPFLQIRAISN
ncbi:MAG: futalosine hydrolase, partial [Saprospiraceae bacterium]|nr:futalosine hydrolase [Saprospiraceae bacterium]